MKMRPNRMNEPLWIIWQHLLPQHRLSRITGWFAHCKWRWLKNAIIHSFIRRYGVDMSIAQQPDPQSYENFNDFFTRALKSEVRPIAEDPEGWVSPVDGCVSQRGEIQDGRLFQAKGFDFSLVDLLGGDTQWSDCFQRGQFATLYLAPKDYHRVHMPLAGKLRQMIYIPGRLFSVNPQTTAAVPGLFARNERVVAIFDTAFGPMALVLVGAMIVASIATTWAGVVAPGDDSEVRVWRYVGDEIELAKGAEMGRFQLGSTVILLLADSNAQWQPEITAGQTVLMGQSLGRFCQPKF